MTEPYAISVDQAFEEFGISKWRLYQLAQSGEIQRKYISKQRYVLIRQSVKDWLDSQTDDPELVGQP